MKKAEEVNIPRAKELYFSVDVEADGPFPGEYSITSIGVFLAGSKNSAGEYVRYDPSDPANHFYAELQPISDKYEPSAAAIGIYIGFDAIKAKTDPDASQRRDYLIQVGETPEGAMNRFYEWVQMIKEREGTRHAVFAGFPLGFDWMWTYWYLCKFSKEGSPFGHSRHIDIKTLYAMKADTLIIRSIKSRMKKSLIPQVKHTHMALDDAIEQGILLMNILEYSEQT